MEKIQHVISALQELESDVSTPKNVKSKVSSTIQALKENSELPIRVSKALHELEELTEDINMQSDTRTQLFNIVSLLEVV